MDASRRTGILNAVTATFGEPSFVLEPKTAAAVQDIGRATRGALRSPIGTPALDQLVAKGDRVLLLVDDLTRLTPKRQLVPPILDFLNQAGVSDAEILILIALGTHRAMVDSEIRDELGDEVVSRVVVENHDFRDSSQLVELGHTAAGTPVIVNRRVLEADFVVGLGSIAPHPEAGWSGGAKILQPGVCGEETTVWTHMLAARQPDHLGLAGDENNPVRLEIEQVGRLARLRFIVNVVLDGAGEVVHVVAGDPIRAHRRGVELARDVFTCRIPRRATAVVVDAYPADRDYWQGIKPLALATRAVKRGGTIVLVGDFSEGVSPVHEEAFRKGGRLTWQELHAEEAAGRVRPGVCTEALYLHAAVRGWADVVCVSKGLSPAEKSDIGFRHAGTVEGALREVLKSETAAAASVGVILQGGAVLPASMEG